MKYTWSVNQYDQDGDVIDEGIFVDVGENVSVKFTDIDSLELFARAILNSLPEIKERQS